MSFTFQKFNSIENAYRKEFIEKIILSGLDKGDFIVQEKVHGANFSFWTDGQTIQCAKRTSFLNNETNFYNYASIQEKYTSSILNLYKAIQVTYPDLQVLTVFGELMGGNAHPSVERIKGATSVQKGIFYSNENDFYAFDIRLNNEKYLNVEEGNALFEEHGFFYAKTLFKGTLEEALKYPNAFDSKIPAWLGFSNITDNICEGVVIRPNESRFFHGGSRVLIKNKNEAWSEKTKRKNGGKTALDQNLSEAANELKSTLETYITENRLHNVISKVGEITFKDFGQVMGLMNQDVLEDFNKEHGIAFKQLEKSEQKILRKYVGKPVRQLLLNYLKQ